MSTPRVQSPNAHLLKDEVWLRTKYINENLSFRKISKLIPCSSLTVSRAIRKFGIPVKPKHITYGDIVYQDRSGKNSPAWKGGKHRCPDCDKELGYRYSKNGIKTRCNSCASKFYRGQNNAFWLPEELKTTPQQNRIRHSADYRDWRNMVFVRDGYKCQICGINSNNLKAHHLDGFSTAPDKRFDVSNGVTLCDPHHIQFHREYGFGGNTKNQFDEFSSKTEVTF
jgi:hypothetical protein